MTSELERGRDCYEKRAWLDAYENLSRADQRESLRAPDLERLAMCAYLIGRDDDYLNTLDRAYAAHLELGATLLAARCAFWLGLRLLFRGEMGRATGWLGRAQRMLEEETEDCAERGYLLLTSVRQQLDNGDWEAACASASRAAAIADRCGEVDLAACARMLLGLALMERGEIGRGLAILDEAMVSAAGRELSPLVTGLVFCGVIEGCQRVYAVGRAREWTAALAQWCDEQPDMVAFSGICLVHRAEIKQMHGAWQEAVEIAQHARERCSRASNWRATAAAFYQQAEVHRLRGELAEAEEAYRQASQWGWEPQPGLALLRVSQGRVDVAEAAIRRVLSATPGKLERARILQACVEIMLATDNADEACRACDELEEIAATFSTDVLKAMAAHARGAVDLAQGNARSALTSLRSAWQTWQEIQAPYLVASVRGLMGLACRALGDHDGGELELAAARAMFADLGAKPQVARIDSILHGAHSTRLYSLTRRELEVLRLVAAGRTNKAIATELFLSEKTVDRHVSNILAKLDVPTRSAATARAYQHRLV